jgi:UDP-N-acetylglucosamine--N-acetylmuramyl-(pentapeptide) pyrophosphoryl-undecaprenol N-acetylglucosamine transferase
VKVVMAGGGTAGHVFPAIAVADRLRDDHGASVMFVGARDGQEAELVPAAGYPFRGLEVVSAQTRVSLRSARALAAALAGSRRIRPAVASADVVVSIGGYASAPALLAARRTSTPVVLIEPNSVPGVVHRIAARWARAVATTFEGTAARLPRAGRIVRTGNPVRRSIVAVPDRRAELAAEARAVFSLDVDRRTAVILGGSQGARHLDEAVAEGIVRLRDRGDLQLLVAAGPAHLEIIDAAADALSGAESSSLLVRRYGFIDRMDLALAVADVAVARAGAGQIAELAVCGVPTVLVPYPHATENHQEANARELVAAGGADLLLDADLSGDRIATGILDLLEDVEHRAQMGKAARAWARPDADERLADLVAEVAA